MSDYLKVVRSMVEHGPEMSEAARTALLGSIDRYLAGEITARQLDHEILGQDADAYLSAERYIPPPTVCHAYTDLMIWRENAKGKYAIEEREVGAITTAREQYHRWYEQVRQQLRDGVDLLYLLGGDDRREQIAEVMRALVERYAADYRSERIAWLPKQYQRHGQPGTVLDYATDALEATR